MIAVSREFKVSMLGNTARYLYYGTVIHHEYLPFACICKSTRTAEIRSFSVYLASFLNLSFRDKIRKCPSVDEELSKRKLPQTNKQRCLIKRCDSLDIKKKKTELVSHTVLGNVKSRLWKPLLRPIDTRSLFPSIIHV